MGGEGRKEKGEEWKGKKGISQKTKTIKYKLVMLRG